MGFKSLIYFKRKIYKLAVALINMAQVGSAARSGEKEIRRDWPLSSGLIAGTTKQEGRSSRLVAEKGSLIPERKKVGLGY